MAETGMAARTTASPASLGYEAVSESEPTAAKLATTVVHVVTKVHRVGRTEKRCAQSEKTKEGSLLQRSRPPAVIAGRVTAMARESAEPAVASFAAALVGIKRFSANVTTRAGFELRRVRAAAPFIVDGGRYV